MKTYRFFYLIVFFLFQNYALAENRSNEVGKIIIKEVEAGRYFQYVPENYQKPIEFVVIIHGCLSSKSQDPQPNAEAYLQRFKSLATKDGKILIVPMFNQKEYGAYSGPLGGYRGLEGNNYKADEFLNQIMDSYKEIITNYNGKFHLIGHSAGGQFACSYISKYPERIKSVTLIAPGVYMFFNESIHWPFGIGKARFMIDWPNSKERIMDYTPNTSKLKRMIQLPIFVVIGEKDNHKKDTIDGQIGNSRLARAKAWVLDLQKYAKNHNIKSNINLSIVKNAGHNSSALFITAWENMFSTKN